jgi:sec-independent protein translocase protein TatB
VFGISGWEFVILIGVAAVVLGPERLPHYAQQLARMVRELRRMARGASEQVRAELGPEFDEVDWRKLDPRQYDPRRIVREALADTLDPDDPLELKGSLGLGDSFDREDPLGLKGLSSLRGESPAPRFGQAGDPSAVSRDVPLDPDAT